MNLDSVVMQIVSCSRCIPYGLGVVFKGHPLLELNEVQHGWYINRLELLAVFLALSGFLSYLKRYHVSRQGGQWSHLPVQVGRACASLGTDQVSVNQSGSH